MSTTSATDIEAVLDESGPDYEDFSFERATSGHRADVYLVTLTYRGEDYEVVVKFNSRNESRFGVEPRLHEFVADRTDIPVPRILVFKEAPQRDVPPYFVTERVHGQNLADRYGDLTDDFWGQVVEQIGEILGDLHSEIAFEGFGRLVLKDGRLSIDQLSWDWQNYFHDLTRTYIDQLEDTPFSNVERKARNGMDRAIDAIPTGGVPRLVHDDLQPANLLYSPEAEDPITTVLDWQDALAAHPEYHLAQVEFLYIDSAFDDADRRADLRGRLYDGYRRHREFDATESYERRRPVYQLSTLLWRMTGFDPAFGEDSGLQRARAEFQHRQQFDRLVDELPDAR